MKKILLAAAIVLCGSVSALCAGPVDNTAHLWVGPWSIQPAESVYDSLRAELSKSALPDRGESFKKYIVALQFRDAFGVPDKPLPALPVSAGIYSGSNFQSGSLSADYQLLFLYRNLGERKAEARILHSLGMRAALKGDLNRAVFFLGDALHLNAILNDKEAVALVCADLAGIHRFRGEFDEAAQYNRRLVQLALESRNNRALAEAYINQAGILTAQKKYKEAESLIMVKVLPLYYYKLKDKLGTMQCYDQLGELYHQQKRMTEAKWFYIQSNTMARSINNPEGIVNSLVNMAHVKMSIGDHQLALRDIREAEQLSVTNKYRYKLVEIKNDLSRVYTMLGNANAADAAKSEFNVLRDALLNTVQ